MGNYITAARWLPSVLGGIIGFYSRNISGVLSRPRVESWKRLGLCLEGLAQQFSALGYAESLEGHVTNTHSSPSHPDAPGQAHPLKITAVESQNNTVQRLGWAQSQSI